MSKDLEYLAIFTLVLILPKLLLRFKVPSGITALLIGTIFGTFDSSLTENQLFRFLSQIGITSLFVFAGLEVDFKEIKNDRTYLFKFLSKSIFVLVAIAICFHYFFAIPLQESIIFSLGIFTPSAGFIMNSLHSYNVSEDQEYWIKSKAISKEIVAILLLFLALQSGEWKSFAISISFFVALFISLPPIFRFFFKFVSPYAPNSEVPFLVVLSLVAGVLSKEVGAYYLVGAFAVGLIGSQFKKEIFKESEHSLFMALSSFFNVFLPFYFFYSGLKISPNELSLGALYIAIGLFVAFVPMRVFLIRMSMKLFLKDYNPEAFNISLSLMPTLIFGLVISSILKERGIIDPKWIYALIIYTIMTSLIPAIIFSIQGKRDSTEPAQQ